MRRSGQSGFSMIEVVVAGVILILAVALLVPSLQYCARASQTAREKAAAMSAARGMAERLRGTPVRQLYLTYGPGGTEGPDFDVDDLNVLPNDADGHCGKITFYTNESANMPEVGLPYDLNGDGDMNDSGADVTGFYQVVPLNVTVEWRGVSGGRSVTLHAVIAERREE